MDSNSLPISWEGRDSEQDRLTPSWSILDKLILWYDPIARTGAECMAIDEALLELSDVSVMRVYRWGCPTVTYGYFDKEETARKFYKGEDLTYMRRWTGGGIVDHRHDIPFSLILLFPKGVERTTSAQLYRWIHGSLARVLRFYGNDCLMLTEDAPNGGRSCFNSPVTSDLVTSAGDKLAGGGQRRTRRGVLHQGSMQNCALPDDWADAWVPRLAESWVISRESEPVAGLNERVVELLATRYEHDHWANHEK